MAGALWVVATPIGNLGDLSGRMEQALREADLIAAEDTRVTMKLLNHLQISKPMISCHRHNERHKAPELVRKMAEEGLKVALTSDAGTPGISDPGVELVRLCHEAGVQVVPVCGPSAVVTALSVSGFDAKAFGFYGFLPREKKPLREKLRQMRSGPEVAVMYESPHRIMDLMAAIGEALPGARACVCCDLTKRFELILVGEAQAVRAQMAENPNVAKGEYVVALDLAAVPPEQQPQPVEMSAELTMLAAMLEGASLADAAEEALARGVSRNEMYRAKLRIKERILAGE